MTKVGSAITLPLEVPLIDVHSFHAFSLAILLTNKQLTMPWILSNYIHIFGVPHFDKGNFIHLATSSNFYEMPYTFVSKLHTEQLRSWFPDHIQFFIDCLNQNQYLSIALDEYYIPDTHSYQKNHLVHHILVHGYDLNQQLFRVAGYFSNPPLFAFNKPVSFELFGEALAHAGPVKQRVSQTLEIIRFPYEDLSTTPYEFDISMIIRSLEDHLLSRPLIEKNPKRIDFWFGMRAYELLVQFLQLEQENNKLIIHMKVLQTLVNHKKIMLERMKYLYEHQYITDSGFIGMSEELLKKTVIVHHLCVKQRIVQDPRNLIRAIKCVQELMDYEKNFLEKLMDHLGSAK
jgi:hypothetical protein